MSIPNPEVHRKQHTSRDLSPTEVLAALMEGTARSTGPAFFSSLVENLASVLDASHAIVGRTRGGGDAARVDTIAAWSNGSLVPNFSYELAGSPCENVLEQGCCVYPAQVCDTFPSDTLLQEMGVQSYVGSALVASPGEPIGVLCVLDDEPLPAERLEMAQTILAIFASRAMAEIDRLDAHEHLVKQHRQLEEVLEERTSELAEAHERLGRASRLAALGTLASGIAHEINNPLGSIRMASDELALDGESEEVRARAVECLVDSVERCKSIVKGIKRFANDEAIEKVPLDANECIEAVVAASNRRLDDASARVSIARLAPAAPIEANRIQLEQVIENLLCNAIETPGVRRVTIRSFRKGDRVVIEVEDDGDGIDDESLPRIFDPFFTTRLREGGTGLGLSICHSIVEDHGGTIDVRRLERGSRFRVELPAVSR